ESGGDLFDAHIFDVVEEYHQPVFGGQRVDGAVELPRRFCRGEEAVRLAGRVEDFQVHRLTEIRSGGAVQRLRRWRGVAAAQVIQAQVCSDPAHPRIERSLCPKAWQRPIDPYKGLLREI